jgi:mRNA-decapping enzyme 1B
MALSINEEARKQANLRLLQKSDPTISDLLGSAAHVVLYNFSQESQSWEKSNVEGSLFLTSTTSNGYILVILNRNAPENYKIQLTPDFQLQNSIPYLIFKQQQDANVVIRGIWFPNDEERECMHGLLTQALLALKTAPPPVVDTGAAIAALLSPLSLGGAPDETPASSYSPLAALELSANTNPRPSSNTNTSTPPLRQTSPSSAHAPMLDKKSLQLALLSLIQDERFLDLLHAQYLKVAHARASRNRNE